ncbi:hypothetical protein EDB19DRAFT_1907147 [Suillus lakei]|nr:hypothetical protein EDB19DRAFT_1907147 [Suillus lakei]
MAHTQILNMSKPGNTSSVSITTPSPSLLDSSNSMSSQHINAVGRQFNFSKDPQEMQSILMTLDEINIQGDKEQTKIFTQYTIDAVCASYATAQS